MKHTNGETTKMRTNWDAYPELYNKKLDTKIMKTLIYSIFSGAQFSRKSSVRVQYLILKFVDFFIRHCKWPIGTAEHRAGLRCVPQHRHGKTPEQMGIQKN